MKNAIGGNNVRSRRCSFCFTTALLASLAATGCSGGAAGESGDIASLGGNLEGSPRTGEQVEPQVREGWFGHDLGASPGTWRYAGPLVVAEVGAEPMEYVVDLEAPSVPEDGPPTFIIGDPDRGVMHSVELSDKDLKLIADHLERLGYAEGNSGNIEAGPAGDDREAGEEEIVEKTWSNGTDQRNPLGLNEFGFNTEPYRKIGQLLQNGLADNATGTCTATFIGTPETEIYVITSSHCLWSSTGTYLDVDFIPRRDACLMPDGPDAGTAPDALAGCDTTSPYTTTSIMPFGRWDGGQWMMDSYYVNNCVGVSPQTTACVGRDIAVLRVTQEAGSGYPGAMGFGSWSFDDLVDGGGKWVRGYPNCNGSDGLDPATNCRVRTLYGQPAGCTLATAGSPETDGNGWDRILKHSCDTSGGMSGSAAYWSQNGSKVFGVHSGGSGAGATPNNLRRMTPEFFGWTLNFMGI